MQIRLGRRKGSQPNRRRLCAQVKPRAEMETETGEPAKPARVDKGRGSGDAVSQAWVPAAHNIREAGFQIR